MVYQNEDGPGKNRGASDSLDVGDGPNQFPVQPGPPVRPPHDNTRSQPNDLTWTIVVAILPFGLDVLFRGCLSDWGLHVLNIAA